LAICGYSYLQNGVYVDFYDNLLHKRLVKLTWFSRKGAYGIFYDDMLHKKSSKISCMIEKWSRLNNKGNNCSNL